MLLAEAKQVLAKQALVKKEKLRDERLKTLLELVRRVSRRALDRLWARVIPHLSEPEQASERELLPDYRQEAWVILLCRKRRLLKKVKGKYAPDGYLAKSVYHALLRDFEKRYRFGTHAGKRRVYYFRPAQMQVRLSKEGDSGLTETDIDMLLDDASPDESHYLSLKRAGHRDGSIRQQMGWSLHKFEQVRESAQAWLKGVLDVHTP